MPTTGESVAVIALLSFALKLLLLPSYQSVEFERQKAWLAITYELPAAEWYSETSSKWALDYPPVYAYFKFFISLFASLVVEPEMLQLNNTDPSSPALITFERLSVIVMDSPLLLGILLYCTTWPSTTTTDMEWSRNKVVVVVALILFNPGLIMVDHIYLHYTGFAVGIFCISLALLRRGDELGDLLGAVFFVVLLMFDHTFFAVVPLLAVYLVRHFCSVQSGIDGKVTGYYSDTRRRSSVSSSDGLVGEKKKGDSGSEEDDEEDDDPKVSDLVRRIALRRRRRLSLQKKEEEARTSPGLILQHMRGEILESNSQAKLMDGGESLSPSSDEGKTHRTSLSSSQINQLSEYSRNVKGSPKRKKSHSRNYSDIPQGFRFQEAYDRLKMDTSFKKLLQRPRSNSASLEIMLDKRSFSFLRLGLLVLVVTATVAACVAPLGFAHESVKRLLWDVLNRLYPSDLSLCRPYWAPNVWALYSGLDKILIIALQWLDFLPEQYSILEVLSLPKGDQDTIFFTLVPVNHLVAALLVLLAMAPALSQVWKHPHHSVLLPAFVYCMTCSFMLGFHIHEKSVLLITVPLTLASCDSTMDARLFLLMSWIAHVSLLPILETSDLKALKPTLLLLHCFASFIALDQYHIMARRARRIRPEPNGGGVWLSTSDRKYFHGLAMTYLFSEVISPVAPFLLSTFIPTLTPIPEELNSLPLMIISLYCAVGMLHCWMLAYQQLTRKVAVIESYQWSPRIDPSKSSLAEVVDNNRIPQLSLFS